MRASERGRDLFQVASPTRDGLSIVDGCALFA